jgi:hypothetical protein
MTARFMPISFEGQNSTPGAESAITNDLPCWFGWVPIVVKRRFGAQ